MTVAPPHAEAWRWSSAGLRLAHPVLNGSGTFDAIAALRTFGAALHGTLPVRGIRLEDDHARAPRRQPTASPMGDPGGADQLDRAAEQGPGGLPASATCRSWPACRSPWS